MRDVSGRPAARRPRASVSSFSFSSPTSLPSPSACRLQADDGLARDRIGDAEPAAEIFEMIAEAVEQADHLRPRVSEFLHTGPFADKAERAVAGLHQRAAAEALEGRIGLSVGVDEGLLAAWFYAKSNGVVRAHCPLRFPRGGMAPAVLTACDG